MASPARLGNHAAAAYFIAGKYLFAFSESPFERQIALREDGSANKRRGDEMFIVFVVTIHEKYALLNSMKLCIATDSSRLLFYAKYAGVT